MKTRLIIIATISAMLFAVEAKAQSTPEEMINKFFGLFEQDVNKAIDYLFSTNEWLEANKEGADAMKEKLEANRKLLGNYNGYEIASKYALGESYLKFICLLKYERQPIELVIFMYKPDKKWKLQNLNFHSDFEKDMIKVER